MIKHIDAWLEDWAEWWAGHMDASAIGYPSSTVEGRAAEGLVAAQLPAHSISPEVMMPPRIAALDRIIRAAPAEKQRIVFVHYVKRDRVRGGWYWSRIDRLHYWLDGALSVHKKPLDRS